MGKKNYTVQWVPDIIVSTGNGSISVADTETGGTDTATTTIYPYKDNFNPDEMADCLVGYGFNDSKMEYEFTDDFKEALKKIVKEVVLEEVLSDKEKEVKAIPIEWIKEYANNLIKLENNNYFAYKGFGDWGEGILSMLEDWEKENEISVMPVSDNSTIPLDYLGERK